MRKHTMNKNKVFGSVLIVIGTSIGAGMLALPMVSAAAGFTESALLMIGLWIVAIMTGLMIIEVNLALPAHSCSFGTMAEKTIGPIGKVVTWISYLLLLYAATAAYMSGASSLIANTIEANLHIKIASWINVLLFTLLLGGAVYWSTDAVDYLNRGLLSIKGLALIITLSLILPDISAPLIAHPAIQSPHFLWAAAPIFICSLCYHIVLPSLRVYVGENIRALKIIIISGITISLIIYLCWLAAILGVIPLTGTHSFTTLAKNNGSVGELVRMLEAITNRTSISICANVFTNIALTTSFLGVSLALFDFLADGFKRKNNRSGRLQTAALTYIPPLIFAMIYPKGFLIALNYAALFIAVLSVVLPVLMVYKLRQNSNYKSPYRFAGGNFILGTVLIIGIMLVALPILTNLNLLPTMH